MIQALDKSLVYKAVEESHFLRSVLHDIIDDIFYHSFSQLHVVFKVGKSYLRLYHPKLGSMSGCIGVFSSKCRSKGIDVAECHGKGLAFQLSAYGKVGFLSEKVLAVVDFAFFGFRQIVHIKSRNSEHLSGAFTVATRNYRGVNIHEILLLEKLVYGVSHQRSYSENSSKSVASRSQMSYLSKKFH